MATVSKQTVKVVQSVTLTLTEEEAESLSRILSLGFMVYERNSDEFRLANTLTYDSNLEYVSFTEQTSILNSTQLQLIGEAVENGKMLG